MSAVLRSHYPRTRFSRAAELAGIATKESVVANRFAPILDSQNSGPTCRSPHAYDTKATFRGGIHFRPPWPISRPRGHTFNEGRAGFLRPANTSVGQVFRPSGCECDRRIRAV